MLYVSLVIISDFGRLMTFTKKSTRLMTNRMCLVIEGKKNSLHISKLKTTSRSGGPCILFSMDKQGDSNRRDPRKTLP